MKLSFLVLLLATRVFAADPHAGHDMSGHAAGGELKDGRYVGWIKLDDTGERMAVVTDFFLESPEDFTQFPSRNALIKMTLGGYNTHEYLTEAFKDIRYDFDNGALTLDEPQNDLMITSEVHSVGSQTLVMGQVFIRSSAVWGTIYLKLQTDEPEDEPEAGEPGEAESSPFLPLLEGQYVGACDDDHAILQIQTVRGLKTDAQLAADRHGLGSEYGIVGRLASTSPNVCGNSKTSLCNLFNYGGGTYNPWLGRLTLQGSHSSEECTVKNGEVKCRIQMQAASYKTCVLKKTDAPGPATFFSRTFHLSPTKEQTEAMPSPAPPKNEALSLALRGIFSGYLHNEATGLYQAVKLNVVPYSYSNNPHNPNQMNVTTTLSSYLGDPAKGEFYTQRFEPRSFYLKPGFTLSGPTADTFLTIVEWKRGFVRAILSSHTFGRVGTVELVKGVLPSLSPGMTLVPSFTGEFTSKVGTEVTRKVRLHFPSQPDDMEKSAVRFSGWHQSIFGIGTVQTIEGGAYDPLTNRLGWLFSKGGATTFVSGKVESNGDIKAYWPPAPSVFGTLIDDFSFTPFRRTGP